jgi:hypothetical protein
MTNSSGAGIIDAHQHVFWHGRDDHGLVRDMDEHGIERAWLLTFEIAGHPLDPDRTRFARILNPRHADRDGSRAGVLLSDLLLARDRHPGRFELGYCPDPTDPRAVPLFEAACEMHAVRICGEWKFRLPIDDPRCIELFRAAGRRKAPVVLHLDAPYLPPRGGTYVPTWYGGTVAHLERVLEACPETTFIGHAPGFWRELHADADTRPEPFPEGPSPGRGRLDALFGRQPNLFADLSARSALAALGRDTSLAADFLEEHAGRLLFGRDNYGGDLLRFLRTLPLAAGTRRKIERDNALALLSAATT